MQWHVADLVLVIEVDASSGVELARGHEVSVAVSILPVGTRHVAYLFHDHKARVICASGCRKILPVCTEAVANVAVSRRCG